VTLDGAQRVAPGMLLRRDVRVVMRDGVQLALNVFLPERDGPWPVLMSVTPYGKDRLPDWKRMLFMRLSRVRFGTLDCSRWTGFESPDPLYWTRAGYAVVQADVRGMHKSEGHASVLSDLDAQDYAELIEWAAGQPWSTGAVGLIGVSYLAMSQWRVAPLRPKGLAAIVPWEGVTDPLRELGYQDGVPETGFVGTWWKYRMRPGHNPRYPMAEDFPAERDRHPFDDEYWSAKRPALERIEAPALVCASWSDHGLHTRGSLEGFERIGSRDHGAFGDIGQRRRHIQAPAFLLQQHRHFEAEQARNLLLQTGNLQIGQACQRYQHIRHLLVIGAATENVQAVANLR